jgi:hypothetical protein
MGTSKSERINKEPLLKEYAKTFVRAISKENSSLLIIGYSFSDEHINKEIDTAIRTYGLKIHILNPEPLSIFLEELLPKGPPGFCSNLHNNIYGYYEATLKDVFPYAHNINSDVDTDHDVINSQSLIWR